MKKLNAIEAANVIGGCKDAVCTSSYETVVVGGVSSCKQVTTCTDKHGTTVSMRDAANGMCVVPNSALIK
ncbi:DUF4762 family protein [Entomohabitans teleogrylli]|uniref:DUF4762 family protein n=1 Tax=Entomohabitans teleogrylli TaxID=1384589 RepID=UPI00073D7149|nr:DUF4762 family protein [Entomohabitans teleogrylli]